MRETQQGQRVTPSFEGDPLAGEVGYVIDAGETVSTVRFTVERTYPNAALAEPHPWRLHA